MATTHPKDLGQLSDDALIKAHVQEASDCYPNGLHQTEAGRAILAAAADRRASLVTKAIKLWRTSGFEAVGRIASELLRANTKEWTAARLVGAVGAASLLNRADEDFSQFNRFPHKPLITAVEKATEREGLSPQLRVALERWKAALMPRPLKPKEERELGEAERIAADNDDKLPWSEVSAAWQRLVRLQRIRTPLTDERKLIERLSRLLSNRNRQPGGEQEITVHIDTTDAVGALIAADRANGKRAAGPAWSALFRHARSLASTAPSKKWFSDAAQLVAAIKADKFGACISDWFNQAGKPAVQALVSYREVSDATLLNDCSVELLKGLAWSVVAGRRTDLAPALGNLAEACYKKVPNIGPRNVKIGNASVAALAALAEPAAAAQLSRLRLRVKHPSSRGTIDKALAAMSQKSGISPDDLAEMAVPEFGFNATGNRRVKLGDCVCDLHAAGIQKVDLRWLDADGRALASVPAIIRKQFAGDLKRLQRDVKDASSMMAAIAFRLERSFLNDRNWPLATWQQRFLVHPLTGTLARRLIWQFDDTLAIPAKGRLVGSSDRRVVPKKNAIVSLWHPLRSAPDQVLAWREWLERHQVTQPFKQAHREIYLLTDPERRTASYSNRFAAHILRQHQFAALCQQRGWDYRLQGEFDSHNVPSLALSAHGLTAEFWVEAIEKDVSPQGIYLYLSSDQVRFGRSLDQVPAAVFSEVMRDIDLFVSVASVANDPTWQEGGPGEPYRTYWEQWSFGELSETAKTRKATLERLVPRLAHAQLFSLTDKFLIVRGQLRTYKIHLGSGNILMEPNDQYLCIVPDRGRSARTTRERIFLPFEGDSTLAVILSKAFLLAEDNKIKNSSILRQIQGV